MAFFTLSESDRSSLADQWPVGQGIDMVGCHDSLITGCCFTGKAGFSATAGVQTKGGSSDITIEKCHFINSGERPLNVGSSTGLDLFRPSGAKFEAKTVMGIHHPGASQRQQWSTGWHVD